MEKEFVPYEQALVLKELGFDEKCLSYPISSTDASGRTWTSVLVTPLYQQAFRWFREKYNLKGFISPVEYLDGTDDTYHWCIYNKCNSGNDQLTYEEAELACLKKLIEIVKEKK